VFAAPDERIGDAGGVALFAGRHRAAAGLRDAAVWPSLEALCKSAHQAGEDGRVARGRCRLRYNLAIDEFIAPSLTKAVLV
jgi:hypothetical protein